LQKQQERQTNNNEQKPIDKQKGQFYSTCDSITFWVTTILFVVLQLDLIWKHIQGFVYTLKGWACRSLFHNLKWEKYYIEKQIKCDTDIGMLRLIDVFMDSGPQVLLQLYVITTQNLNESGSVVLFTFKDFSTTSLEVKQFVSILSSLLSMGYAIAGYHRCLRNQQFIFCLETNKPLPRPMSWLSTIMQFLWYLFLISPRVLSLAIFASTFRSWFFMIIFTHWLIMYFWILRLKTNYCITSQAEYSAREEIFEKFYDFVCSFIYIFVYFNLKSGPTRLRYLIYYFIYYSENVLFCLSYFFHSKESNYTYKLCMLLIVLIGFWVAITFQIIYYLHCHPSHDIRICVRKEAEFHFIHKKTLKAPRYSDSDSCDENTNDFSDRDNQKSKERIKEAKNQIKISNHINDELPIVSSSNYNGEVISNKKIQTKTNMCFDEDNLETIENGPIVIEKEKSKVVESSSMVVNEKSNNSFNPVSINNSSNTSNSKNTSNLNFSLNKKPKNASTPNNNHDLAIAQPVKSNNSKSRHSSIGEYENLELHEKSFEKPKLNGYQRQVENLKSPNANLLEQLSESLLKKKDYNNCFYKKQTFKAINTSKLKLKESSSSLDSKLSSSRSRSSSDISSSNIVTPDTLLINNSKHPTLSKPMRKSYSFGSSNKSNNQSSTQIKKTSNDLSSLELKRSSDAIHLEQRESSSSFKSSLSFLSLKTNSSLSDNDRAIPKIWSSTSSSYLLTKEYNDKMNFIIKSKFDPDAYSLTKKKKSPPLVAMNDLCELSDENLSSLSSGSANKIIIEPKKTVNIYISSSSASFESILSFKSPIDQ
jgi:hypothetical protein